MGEAKKRALIVTRLSRVTEATSSIERQEAECRKLCEEREYEVAGVAKDENVSAAVRPASREDLGKWLATPQRYDILVFYRMDRLVRRLSDLADLIAWGQANGVKLVSATERFLDLDAPFGDVVALLVAKCAEMELEAIRARTGSAARHTITAGRWRGGVPPWGYVPAKDGRHWKLVHDAPQVEVIREVVDRVLEQEQSLRSIAHDLTRRGVPTPKDRVAQLKKREVKGYEWHSSPLKRALTSPAMLGRIVTREAVLGDDGQPLRDDKGSRVMGPETVVVDEAGVPVVRAAPILDEETFRRLGDELTRRENRREPTKRMSGLLLQVIACGDCGRPGYRQKGGPGRRPRYRCASAQYMGPCDNRTIDLRWAEGEVVGNVLGRLGEMERMRRVWDTGTDTAAALAEVREMIGDVGDLIGGPGFRKGTPQRERLEERLKALAAREAELEAVPAVPAGWRYEGTGQTVRAWWDGADDEARNLWLRDMGVKATWVSRTEGGVLQTSGKFEGKVIGGRTEVKEWSIDIGTLDTEGEVLPSTFVGLEQWKRAAGGRMANIPDVLAQVRWRDGDGGLREEG
ncbi:MAG: recombinase family protein [Gordonia sp. (in: high G+C Gram-positive bacteria)]